MNIKNHELLINRLLISLHNGRQSKYTHQFISLPEAEFQLRWKLPPQGKGQRGMGTGKQLKMSVGGSEFCQILGRHTFRRTGHWNSTSEKQKPKSDEEFFSESS